MIRKILNIFRVNNIGEPPWEYDFLLNLPESEYPKYLAKIFNVRTGEKLPLKFDFKTGTLVINKNKCKTFNQKIQWLKLYGVTNLMRMCTDKVAVRDYVKEKIGEKYLKPVLQICNSFNEIDFNKLPNAFVIKCNHGCKWQYIIKDKWDFLNTQKLIEIVERQITGWLEQEYFPWNGFELQYKVIQPKILIEPLMRDEIDTEPIKVNVYCFNGKPKIIYKFLSNNYQAIWDETLNSIEDIFLAHEKTTKEFANHIIKQITDLTKKLSYNFNFVRIDWMIYKNQLYFEETTFTPYSGFHRFKNLRENLNLGKNLQIGE